MSDVWVSDVWVRRPWCRALLLAITLSCAPRLAAGQERGFDAQQLRPLPGGRANLHQVVGAATPGHLAPSFGAYTHYGWRPLIVEEETSGQVRDVLRHQTGVDLGASLGLGRHVEIGALLPLTPYQGGDEAVAPDQDAALGDLRALLKVSLRGREAPDWDLALAAIAIAPTGSGSALRSDGSFGIEPRLIAEWRGERWGRLSANLGASFADRSGAENLDGSSARAIWAIGHIAPIPSTGRALAATLEAYGSLPVGGERDDADLPAEALLGARYTFAGGHAAQIAAGPGLTRGFGTPTVRAVASYLYTPASRGDRDADGVPDLEDACPDRIEDVDGHLDLDGCPDPDNDQDELLDIDDACPDEAEDRDGFEDEDGCPDPDNDRDGVPDGDDRCPLTPEDIDGFEDQDGCPELDNDGDGVLDGPDDCPLEPEDFDGFEDQDGCPDADNDRDGVPDVRDACPEQQEVYNGVEDEDGCPDRGARDVEFTRERILLRDEIYFDTDRAKIKSASRALLIQLAAFLNERPEIRLVEIQGHTDDRGSQAWNMDLSWRRARNVRRVLLRHGVSPARLILSGFGKTRPLVRGRGARARARNRRVEFRILRYDAPSERAP